jgi:mannosyltransferase
MLTQQGMVVPAAAPSAALRKAVPAAPERRPAAFLTAAWFLPVLLTAALGLYRSTTMVLWWDELSTLDIARRPVTGILATATHVDAVHSAYYLFMHFWIEMFGDSVLSVRMPSVLAMCGATACTGAIAHRLFDRRVAWTSAAVFALIPGVDRYASETRSYGLVVLGSALALLLLLRALERPDPRRWAAYSLMVLLTGALNLIALTALSAHAVVVLTSRRGGRRGPVKAFALSVGAALLPVIPILVFGALEAGSELGPLPKITLSSLPVMWQETGCSTAFSVIVLIALPIAFTHSNRASALTVGASALLPILALLVVSINSMGFGYFARYLLFVLPAWAIAVAAAVDRVKGVPTVTFVAVVLATAAAVAHDQVVLHDKLSHFEYDYPGPRVTAEDYPAAAAVIESRYRPGDAASFSGSPHLDLGVNYYLPANEQLSDLFVRRTDRQTDSLTPEFCPDTARCAAAAPDRLWVVESGDVAPLSTERPDWAFVLDYTYRDVETWHVQGITLTLFDRVAPR